MKKYCDLLACADPRPLAWAFLFQAFGLKDESPPPHVVT
jgi:hypothetical protein